MVHSSLRKIVSVESMATYVICNNYKRYLCVLDRLGSFVLNFAKNVFSQAIPHFNSNKLLPVNWLLDFGSSRACLSIDGQEQVILLIWNGEGCILVKSAG